MTGDFIDGITSYSRAFGYLRRENVWVYALIPSLIGMFLGGFALWSILEFSDNIGNWLTSRYPFDFGADVVATASVWISGLAMSAFTLLIFKYLILIISAPFMSPLSEKIEQMELGQSKRSGFNPAQLLSDLWRGLRISLRNIIREIGLTIVLLILGLFPLFSVFTPVLIFLVQAYYAGFGNMDYTLERYHGVRGSVQFVRKHKGLALGNGSIFMLAMTIPFIGVLLIIPLATIASTIETIKRLGNDQSLTNL